MLSPDARLTLAKVYNSLAILYRESQRIEAAEEGFKVGKETSSTFAQAFTKGVEHVLFRHG